MRVLVIKHDCQLFKLLVFLICHYGTCVIISHCHIEAGKGNGRVKLTEGLS